MDENKLIEAAEKYINLNKETEAGKYYCELLVDFAKSDEVKAYHCSKCGVGATLMNDGKVRCTFTGICKHKLLTSDGFKCMDIDKLCKFNSLNK